MEFSSLVCAYKYIVFDSFLGYMVDGRIPEPSQPAEPSTTETPLQHNIIKLPLLLRALFVAVVSRCMSGGTYRRVLKYFFSGAARILLILML